MTIDYPIIVTLAGEGTRERDHYIINSPDQFARFCHAELVKLTSEKYFLRSDDFIDTRADREVDDLINSNQYLDDDDLEIAKNVTMENAQSLPEPFKSEALEVLTYVENTTARIRKRQADDHRFNADVRRVLDAGEDGWKIPSDTSWGYLVIDLLDYLEKTRYNGFKIIPAIRFED